MVNLKLDFSVIKHYAMGLAYNSNLWEIGYLAQVSKNGWCLTTIPGISNKEMVSCLTDEEVYKELVKIKEYKS